MHPPADHQTARDELLAQIRRAGADALQAKLDGDRARELEQERLVYALGADGFELGISFQDAADAQREGQERVRVALEQDVLQELKKATDRRRDAERRYVEAIVTASQLKVSRAKIAKTAGVAHATIGAIIARNPPPQPTREASPSSEQVSDSVRDASTRPAASPEPISDHSALPQAPQPPPRKPTPDSALAARTLAPESATRAVGGPSAATLFH